MTTTQSCTASVHYGDIAIRVPFAHHADAAQFIQAQARAATQLGAHRFQAVVNAGADSTVMYSTDVTGPDLADAVAEAAADAGLVTMTVAGTGDTTIYAHRSQTIPGALLIGVDADADQRILFVVNDGDLIDTTVGARTGTIDLSATPSPASTMAVTATVETESAAQTVQILEALVCCQPIHFGDARSL